jgi:hypothetical protein
MKEDKTSYSVIGKLFDSMTPKDKMFELKSNLEKFKTYYDTNPKNPVIRDKYLQLNCQCGDFYLAIQDYTSAKNYYKRVFLKAPEEHFLKFLASSKLFEIAQIMALHSGSTAAG